MKFSRQQLTDIFSAILHLDDNLPQSFPPIASLALVDKDGEERYISLGEEGLLADWLLQGRAMRICEIDRCIELPLAEIERSLDNYEGLKAILEGNGDHLLQLIVDGDMCEDEEEDDVADDFDSFLP